MMSELVGIVSEKLEHALNAADGGLSERRQRLFDRYYGAKEGTERAGYSSFTTREVMEAVETAKPVLVRALMAPGVVSFEPASPEDSEAAEIETKVVRHHIAEGE